MNLKFLPALANPTRTTAAPRSVACGPPPWAASLELRFARDFGGCTRLVRNQHRGPLRVQKPLHPEPGVAHAMLLHPPGGLAGGDALDIRLQVGRSAQVLATTPGAGKWYHGERGSARQSVHLEIDADACLEWLPQEAILFEGADAMQSLEIVLHAQARMIGWDIVQLGRVAAEERWLRGRWRQRIRLVREGRERWREQVDLAADDPLRESPLGLAGHPVLASAWAAAPGLHPDEDLLAALRAHTTQSGIACGIGWLPAPTSLLMVRALGADCERVRALLESLWSLLRPVVCGRPAQRPRIWST